MSSFRFRSDARLARVKVGEIIFTILVSLQMAHPRLEQKLIFITLALSGHFRSINFLEFLEFQKFEKNPKKFSFIGFLPVFSFKSSV